MVRQKLLIGLVGALLLVAPASALASSGSCASSTSSALNQYCENLPAATGGGSPNLGTRAVASSLAPSVARAIARSGRLSPRRKLLTLPAAGPRHPLPQGAGSSGTTGSSPLLLILLVLAAIALAAIAVTVQRRRHRLRVAAEIHG